MPPAPSKPFTRSRAWSCLLINQFATPGLGSMMGGHYIAGVLQLLLALVGCGLMLFWICKYFYGIAFQPLSGPDSAAVPIGAYGWIGIWGLLCLALSWIWSGITSLQLLQRAKREEVATPGTVPNNPVPGTAPGKSEGAG